MNRDITRLLLSIVAVGGGVPAYIICAVMLDGRGRSRSEWTTAGVSAVVSAIAIAWSIIWRRVIAWTWFRSFLVIVSMLPASAAAWAIAFVLRRPGTFIDVCELLGSLCGEALWLAAVVLIWRETAVERVERAPQKSVPCPICGYNLAGLRSTTCPECGREFRIDELVRSNSDPSLDSI